MPALLWAVLLAAPPDAREVTGQVLDMKGKPVAGAKVVVADQARRAEATTDAAGRFSIKSGLAAPAFLFVAKDGFRFHGQRLAKAGSGVDAGSVTLTRRDEPAPKKMTSLPPALPLEKRKKLAEAALEPLLKGLGKAKEEERIRALEAIAAVDPGRVLEELDKQPLKQSWYDGYVRRAVAKGLQGNAEEARSVVESIKDAGFRTHCLLDLHDATPAAKKADRLACLNQALVASQGEKKNDHRLITVGWVARRLLAMGEKERATKLLRDGEKVAKALPTDGWAAYARGAFAEELAFIDRPAALALMKDIKDAHEYLRHHGNLARRIASIDPAEAERLLQLPVKGDKRQWEFQIDQYAIGVCHGIAPVDLARARKVAASIKEEPYRARALANMADALAKSKPKEALGLLDEAFALLEKRIASGKDSFNNYSNAASLAGLSLGAAERIDPALVPEFFWRAVAMHPVPTGKQEEVVWGHRAGAAGALALTLARYDRELAKEILGTAGPLPKEGAHMREKLLRATAVIDPPLAVAELAKQPAGRDSEHVRKAVLGALLADGEALSKLIHHAMAEWHIGDEDV